MGPCRCCLADDATLRLRPHVLRRLEVCFSITIRLEPRLPDELCAGCLSIVNESFDFYRKCLNAQRALAEIPKDASVADEEAKRKLRDRFDRLNESENRAARPILAPSRRIGKFRGSDPKRKNGPGGEAREIRILPKPETRRPAAVPENENAPVKLDASPIKSCFVCNVDFPTTEKLTQHNLKVHFPPSISDTERLSCDICDRKFKQKLLLTRHRKRLHSSLEDAKRVCGRCDENFDTLYDLRVHQKTCVKKESRFRNVADDRNSCSLCKMSFADLKDLENHMRTHDANLCEYCNGGFGSVALLLRHIAEEHNTETNPYSCVQCKKAFSMKKILLQHQRVKHCHPTETFHCGHCKMRGFKLEQLWSHVQSTHPESSEVFNKKPSMPDLDESINMESSYITFEDIEVSDKHCIESMNEKDVFQINYILPAKLESIFEDGQKDVKSDGSCKGLDNVAVDMLLEKDGNNIDDNFLNDKMDVSERDPVLSATISDENEDVHRISNNLNISNSLLKPSIKSNQNNSDEKDESAQENKGHKCKICSKKFTKLLTLQKHMSGHKSQTCVGCDFTAENQDSLKRHIKQCTTFWKLNNLACSVCGKKLTSEAGLRYHIKTHYDMKQYSCPRCPRTFLTTSNLNVHVRAVHSNVKPHFCLVCSRTFATVDHLQKHITAAHTNRRDHRCEVCNRGFTQKSHLVQHSWTHTGIKPYNCPHCSNKYTTRCSLNKHLHKIHREIKNTESSCTKELKEDNAEESPKNNDQDVVSSEGINPNLLEDINVVIVEENGNLIIENIIEYGKRFELDLVNDEILLE